MTSIQIEDFINKFKKVTKKPKNSKYYKKFMIILKKHKEKFKKGKKQPYVPKFEHSNEKLIESFISTSDSGISQVQTPDEPPKSFLINALIEPLPKKYNAKTSTRSIQNTDDMKVNRKTTTEEICNSKNRKIYKESPIKTLDEDSIPKENFDYNKRCFKSEIIQKIQKELPIKSLEEDFISSCSKKCLKSETTKESNIKIIDDNFILKEKPINNEEYPNMEYRRCSKSFYRSAYGYSTLQKWNKRMSLCDENEDKNKRPKSLHVETKPNLPPKKPPRLFINTNTKPTPIKSVSASISTSASASSTKSKDDLENAIATLTSTLKSQDYSNNTTISCSNDVYSKFKRGLSRRSSLIKNDVKDDKFVVNLYESRQSKRWKRQSLPAGHGDGIRILDDPPKVMMMIQKKSPVDGNEKLDDANDEIYFKMKKMRDMECVKMKEASNALSAIKNKSDKTWSEELLAESILLQTELRYKTIVNELRKSKETEINTIKHQATGGVTLSNFQFELPQQDDKKKADSTTFYLLAVTNDTDVVTTKEAVATIDNKVVFNETFPLRGLNEDFQIKIELFSIVLNTAKMGFLERLLKKRAKCCCPLNKIYFENVNTYEMQESSILKSSFTSCGEFTITKKDFGSSMFLMKNYQPNKVKNTVTATINVDYLDLNSKLSGFLTLGKMDENRNVHYWERKWCSLINNTFSIYNYPQDEESDKPPVATINLEYCFIPVVKNPKDCPRKRTFIVKTGRPRTFDDSNCKQLKRKNNFILNKYYFSADSKEEFRKWTEELDAAVEELDAWGRLVFKDEYYL